MSGYIGRTPLSEAIQSRAKYTATANQTTFSFSYQPGFLDVYLNGIKLEDTTDYTATTGTEIVLTTGATAGHVLEAVGLSTFSLLTGKHNYSATAAPAVTDDSADGYRVGSMWIDTTNDEAYRCVDDTVGAAVWIGTTLETTDLGSLAMVTPTGTGSTSTFLRGDNSWTTVDTDLVSDTTPQLGGNLDGQSYNITTSGNVGIGTNSPSYKLQVNGQTQIGGSATQIAPSSSDIRTTSHAILGGQGGNALYVGQYPSSTSASNYATWLQSSYHTPSTATYDLVVNPLGGDVGIGVADPESLLHLNQTGTNEGQITFGADFNGSEHNAGRLYFKHDSGWTTELRLGTASNHSASYRDELIIKKGYVTMPNQPAFRMFNSGSNDQSPGVVTYNSAPLNVGGHANTTNGRFTAPVTGTYFLSFTSFQDLNATEGATEANIQVNGSRVFRIYDTNDNGTSYGPAVTVVGVAFMNANDYADVDINYTTHGNAGDYFCGYLIG